MPSAATFLLSCTQYEICKVSAIMLNFLRVHWHQLTGCQGAGAGFGAGMESEVPRLQGP